MHYTMYIAIGLKTILSFLCTIYFSFQVYASYFPKHFLTIVITEMTTYLLHKRNATLKKNAL